MLLHLSTDFPEAKTCELPAKGIGGPYLELLDNAETVTARDESSSVVPSPRPLHIACNQKCVSLAKRAMASQETASHKSVDESMRYLWSVFKTLFEETSGEKLGPICNIYSARTYGDIWRFQELVWEPGTDPELRFHSMVNTSPVTCSMSCMLLN